MAPRGVAFEVSPGQMIDFYNPNRIFRHSLGSFSRQTVAIEKEHIIISLHSTCDRVYQFLIGRSV